MTCPAKQRYIALLTARRTLQGLSDGRPQWTVSAALDALLPLQRPQDYRAPAIVSAAAGALQAALGECLGQRDAVVSGATLLFDAALAAESEKPVPAKQLERYP